MDDLILSLDIGTTLIKCILFNQNGQEKFVFEERCVLITPQAGWCEINPDELWSTIVNLFRKAKSASEIADQIIAIVISSQGGSVVAVNSQGNALTNIVTWMDQRALTITKDWARDGTSQYIRQQSGWYPQPGLPISTIQWFKQFENETFLKTHKWLSVNDFAVNKLVNNFVTNPSMAGEMLLTNITSGEWDPTLCEIAGIEVTQLSKILPSDCIVGNLTSEISKITGLQCGLPIINGGQDHACEAYALSGTQSNMILACGTAWVINLVAENTSLINIPESMDINFHVLPNLRLASQFLGDLGSYVNWALNVFWKNNLAPQIAMRDQFSAMNQALLTTNKIQQDLFFLPLNGSKLIQNSENAGGFIGVQPIHQREDLTKAIFETAAFEVKASLSNLSASQKPYQMWMIGGATKSPIWPQIIADVCDLEVLLTTYTHGPALGAAMLAWKSLGKPERIEHFRNELSKNAHSIFPIQENRQIYSNKNEKYKRLITSNSIATNLVMYG
ncbi:MAG: FGGY-family carbohydrate kinase [Anaerolineaceae bacterium]|nr:FGGY-family carbohydrate kinase [Anaerolineaceae bacterium]